MYNACSIKDTIQDPDIWLNELYKLNLDFNKVNGKYEKYEDEIKAHLFDVLPE